MLIQLTGPSTIDAKFREENLWQPRFYKGRKTSQMFLIESKNKFGTTIDSLLVKVSSEGKLSIERLSAEITEDIDKNFKEPKTGEQEANK